MRIRQKGHYAACRGVISARVARPVSVSEYGASNSWPTFATSRFRFRYCMRAFIDRRGRFNEIATSLIRNAPESESLRARRKRGPIGRADAILLRGEHTERIGDVRVQPG